jgi:hypothetical protein
MKDMATLSPYLRKLNNGQPPLKGVFAIGETYLMGSHPRAPCKLDNILQRGRGKSHTRLLLGHRSHPFYLYPTATGQWRATV